MAISFVFCFFLAADVVDGDDNVVVGVAVQLLCS